MSNCLLFPWVLPLRWSIQIFFYDKALPGTCMFFIVDTTSIIIYGISLLSVVYKHFDILNLILFMPEEGKPETSWSKKQKRKVFGFHSIQATLVRCLLFCHLFRKCIEKCSYLFSVGCMLFVFIQVPQSFALLLQKLCWKYSYLFCVGCLLKLFNVHLVPKNWNIYFHFPHINALLITGCLIVALVGGSIPLIITPWAFLSFGGW